MPSQNTLKRSRWVLASLLLVILLVDGCSAPSIEGMTSTELAQILTATPAPQWTQTAAPQRISATNTATLPPTKRPATQTPFPAFSFAVTTDIRQYAGSGEYDTPRYFRGAAEAIAAIGTTAFMVSPGDNDYPDRIRWTIDEYLGPDYLWYPAAGNHEAGNEAWMDWYHSYNFDPNGDAPPNLVDTGPYACPKTTYAFDYQNAHFVILDEYCTANSEESPPGDVDDALYNWLSADLSENHQPVTFVFGHEPAYPQPDSFNDRERHMDDSLNQNPAHRDRFWRLLKQNNVVAYITGHTHNYSTIFFGGVWQLDAGHAAGAGDTGAPSTFVIVHVNGDVVTFDTYRDDSRGGAYTLAVSGMLAP